MKGPKDQLNADDYDNLEEYITDAMDVGYVIEAEDFEGRRCAYCGQMIPFSDFPDGVVIWETQVQEPGEEPDPTIVRTYFCSKDCRRSAKHDEDFLRNGSEYQEPDRIHEDDLEGMV